MDLLVRVISQPLAKLTARGCLVSELVAIGWRVRWNLSLLLIPSVQDIVFSQRLVTIELQSYVRTRAIAMRRRNQAFSDIPRHLAKIPGGLACEGVLEYSAATLERRTQRVKGRSTAAGTSKSLILCTWSHPPSQDQPVAERHLSNIPPKKWSRWQSEGAGATLA